MVPHSICLTNFRSFRNSTTIPLDFAPIYCIIGKNGSGKSSIVEAMLWALFGKAREGDGDAVVTKNLDTVSVEFVFSIGNEQYKVSRSAGRISFLNLYKRNTETGTFDELAVGRKRETQTLINQMVGTDFFTMKLANFFMQNESDAFSKMRPSERHKSLVKLFNIENIEKLRKAAADRIRLEAKLLDANMVQLNLLHDKLRAFEGIEFDFETVCTQMNILNSNKQALDKKRECIEKEMQILQKLINENNTLLDKHTILSSLLERLNTELKAMKQKELRTLEIIEKAKEIESGFLTFCELKSYVVALRDSELKFLRVKEAIARVQLQQAEFESEIQAQTAKMQGERVYLMNAIQLLDKKIIDKTMVMSALEKLTDIENVHKNLQTSKVSIANFSEQISMLQRAILAKKDAMNREIAKYSTEKEYIAEELERKKQFTCARKEIEQKIAICFQNRAENENLRLEISQLVVQQEIKRNERERLREKYAELTRNLKFVETTKTSRCPTCGSVLDELRRMELASKIDVEIKIITNEGKKLTTLCNELETACAEKEARIRHLNSCDETESLNNLLIDIKLNEKRCDDLQKKNSEIEWQIELLQQEIATEQYSAEERAQIAATQKQIDLLDFTDEKFNIACQNYEEFVGLKNRLTEIERFASERMHLLRRFEELEEQICEISAKRQYSLFDQQLVDLKKDLSEIEFDESKLQMTNQKLANFAKYEKLSLELEQARNDNSELTMTIPHIQAQIAENLDVIAGINERIAEISKYCDAFVDIESELKEVTWEIEKCTNQYMNYFELKTRLEEKILQKKLINVEVSQISTEIADYKKRSTTLLALEYILKSTSIQAWLLKKYISAIENEAQEILDQIAHDEARVKLLADDSDKIEVHIITPYGERSYESFSGGEEFRIDFALKLALAQVLSQRAGLPIRTLIIDEGFGSQDEAALLKLVELLYEVRLRFETIIVITHLERLVGEFYSRIEVEKICDASQVAII